MTDMITIKHVFLLRARYGDGKPWFDSYQPFLWPAIYGMVNSKESYKALQTLLGCTDEDPQKEARAALFGMELRARFNNDIKGPYIVTSQADGAYSLTPDWAEFFWGMTPGPYDMGDMT